MILFISIFELDVVAAAKVFEAYMDKALVGSNTLTDEMEKSVPIR